MPNFLKEELLNKKIPVSVFPMGRKKEAYSKALGGRLFDILSNLKSSHLEGSSYLNRGSKAIWLSDSYVYALAVQGQMDTVRYWLYTDK